MQGKCHIKSNSGCYSIGQWYEERAGQLGNKTKQDETESQYAEMKKASSWDREGLQ